MRTWAWRAGVALVVWGGFVAVMTADGMEPRLVPLAALVGTLVLFVSLVIDVGQQPVANSDWPVTRAAATTSTGDVRVIQLQRAIESAISTRGRDAKLRRLLATIIEERVRVRYGTDRAAEPERYRSIVGGDLLAWLDLPDSEQAPIRRREFDRIVRRIETL